MALQRASGNAAVAQLLADEDAAEVEAVAEAIEATIDGATVADQLRSDAGTGPAAAETAAAAETSGDIESVQTADPEPAPPRAGDEGTILDAVLALPAVKQLMDRLGEFVAATLRRDGYGGAVALGVVALPGVAALANQGLGIHKFSLATPTIKLDDKHTMQFRFRMDVGDPAKRISIPSASLEWRITF